MSKSSLLKNARNYAEYLRKKERGPVKAFFHITKNESIAAAWARKYNEDIVHRLAHELDGN